MPATLHIIPVLTAVAASGVALLMLGATRIHLRGSEEQAVNVVLAGLALLVAVTHFWDGIA